MLGFRFLLLLLPTSCFLFPILFHFLIEFLRKLRLPERGVGILNLALVI